MASCGLGAAQKATRLQALPDGANSTTKSEQMIIGNQNEHTTTKHPRFSNLDEESTVCTRRHKGEGRMSIKPYGYMWAGIFIPANGSQPWHRKDGIALYAIPDTHRVVPVELLKEWAHDLDAEINARDIAEQMQAIIEDKPCSQS